VIASQKISNWLQLEEEIKKMLGLENVKILTFLDYDKKNHTINSYFTEKDIDWYGAIQKADFRDFLNEPFDLLIGYFDTKNIFLELAVLKSKATFKVGFSDVNQRLYDMEIAEIPSNIDNFLNELKKYLVILKKMKN
jgi:acetolactate synthase small subunit